jgi:hypothetical protein
VFGLTEPNDSCNKSSYQKIGTDWFLQKPGTEQFQVQLFQFGFGDDRTTQGTNEHIKISTKIDMNKAQIITNWHELSTNHHKST